MVLIFVFDMGGFEKVSEWLLKKIRIHFQGCLIGGGLGNFETYDGKIKTTLWRWQ